MKKIIALFALVAMLTGCTASALIYRQIKCGDWYRGCQLEPAPCHIVINEIKGGKS